MKVNELRIGNYITGFYEDLEGSETTALCKVVALDSVGVTDNTFWVESKDIEIEKYDGFEGVKITSEKLKHFGFEVEEREGLISLKLCQLTGKHLNFQNTITDLNI